MLMLTYTFVKQIQKIFTTVTEETEYSVVEVYCRVFNNSYGFMCENITQKCLIFFLFNKINKVQDKDKKYV